MPDLHPVAPATEYAILRLYRAACWHDLAVDGQTLIEAREAEWSAWYDLRDRREVRILTD